MKLAVFVQKSSQEIRNLEYFDYLRMKLLSIVTASTAKVKFKTLFRFVINVLFFNRHRS